MIPKILNFEFHFIFSKNWILVCLWTWEKFSPDTLGENFEVIKLNL